MLYRHNDAHVAAEEFDGELVLINFSRGTYFSLRHVAVDVWRQFAGGAEAVAVVERVREHFAVADGTRAELARCVQMLVDEELLCAAEAAGPPVDAWSSATWAAPVVEVYSDLRDLIVLDPVHEVDDSAGWPRRAAGRGDA
jgi:hypothetical protein